MNITRRGRTLILAGDFDVRSTTEVRDALYDHLAAADGDPATGGEVVVDLTRVESIDSTALKVLAMATRRASHSGRRLVLRGACPAVRRMLHLTRLIRVVRLERICPGPGPDGNAESDTPDATAASVGLTTGGAATHK